MKKIFLSSVSLLLLGSLVSFTPSIAQADEPINVSENTEKSARTLIITANGNLEGSLVPYIQGVPNTGSITIHYSSKSLGFIDGDTSKLTIKLPQEFKFIANQPEFKTAIRGEAHVKKLFNEQDYAYNMDDITVYNDRIIFSNPSEFWLIGGSFSSDIVIDYGKILEKYPNIPIKDNFAGYKFQSALSHSSAPWDPSEDPIFGTYSGVWTTYETQAIYK